MQKLTKTYIERLPKVADGKQAFHWDSEQRGLGLRVTSGTKAFVFQRRVNGKTARVTIGAWPDMTVDDARERARKMAVMVDDGIDPRRQAKKDQAANTTLKQTFEKFLSERKLKQRTQYDYQRYFNIHLTDWLDKTINEIDGDMVIKRYKKIAESSSGQAQASSVMRVLRSVINFAQADLGKAHIPENPVATLTAKRAWLKDNARTDHLRQHEIKPFVDALRSLDNPTMGAYPIATMLDFNPPKSALVVCRQIEPFTCDPDELNQFPSDEFAKTYELLSDIAIVLTAVGPRASMPIVQWFTFDDPDLEDASMMSGSRRGYLHEILPYGYTKYPLLDPVEAPEIVRAFLKLHPKTKDRVRLALHRLNQAQRRRNPGDQAVELSTAFETLLGDGNNHEMTHKIKVRLVRLLGGDKDARKRNAAIISKTYDFRSKLVHTGDVNIVKQVTICDQKMSASEIIEAAIAMCAELIKKIIQQGSIPQWESFDITDQA